MTEKLQIQVGGTSAGVTAQSVATDLIDLSPEHFDNIAKAIKSASTGFEQKLAELPSQPKEYTIEFGVSLGGNAGIPFIAKGTVGANFKVAIKWTND